MKIVKRVLNGIIGIPRGLWENKKSALFLLILLITCHYMGYFDWIYEIVWSKPYTPNIIIDGGAAPITPQ